MSHKTKTNTNKQTKPILLSVDFLDFLAQQQILTSRVVKS